MLMQILGECSHRFHSIVEHCLYRSQDNFMQISRQCNDVFTVSMRMLFLQTSRQCLCTSWVNDDTDPRTMMTLIPGQ